MEFQAALPSTFPLIDITTEEPSSHRNSSDHGKVLQVSSGNLQPSALDSLGFDGVKKENPADLIRVRPRRNNTRTVATARAEHRKRRRAAAGKVEGSNRRYDINRYRQYRNREARYREDENETVWPPELEEAFIEGHEIVGPIGRQKKPVDGQLRGRFQLIGEYVYRKTGQKRDRKQVSSHNQVLKGYLGPGVSFRVLLPPRRPTDDPNEDDLNSPDSLELFLAGLLPRNLHPTYLKERALERADQSPPTGQILNANCLTSFNQHIWPLDFAMWVQTQTKPSPSPNPSSSNDVHIYTNLTASPMLECMPLEDLPQWREDFPKLASLHESGAMDCEITLLETTLNMNVPSTPLSGCVLATQFEILAAPAYAGHTWQCITHIYCFGEPSWSIARSVPHADAGHGDGHVKLRPPFASDYWAHTFVRLAEELPNSNRETARERTRKHIQSLTAVQELFATIPGEEPKRVALYLWQFNTTKPGETEGRTTWRNLYPPPSRILTNSPTPAVPNAASLQETLNLWEDQYGSMEPSGDTCVLDFGPEQKPESVMAQDSAISMFYPNLEAEMSQENTLVSQEDNLISQENNMAFTLPLVPPEPFDETASLSAFLESYADSTTAATCGSPRPYRAAPYWQRHTQSYTHDLAQGFTAPGPSSFTDQLQDMTETTANEDFGLVFE